MARSKTKRNYRWNPFKEKKVFCDWSKTFQITAAWRTYFFEKIDFPINKILITQNFEYFRHSNPYSSKEQKIWNNYLLNMFTLRFSVYLLKCTLEVEHVKKGIFLTNTRQNYLKYLRRHGTFKGINKQQIKTFQKKKVFYDRTNISYVTPTLTLEIRPNLKFLTLLYCPKSI